MENNNTTKSIVIPETVVLCDCCKAFAARRQLIGYGCYTGSYCIACFFKVFGEAINSTI
jgi:hypothetical protein